MAQVAKNVQNNFIAGLKTEYTGLNFPENAATSCSNMDFSLIGDASRRGGIDYETNNAQQSISLLNVAVNSYKWNNVGGDGQTQLVVLQSGTFLNFFRSSTATTFQNLSTQHLLGQIDISTFVASGGTFDTSQECQFADGNGYLFVFHPNCDPFYCTYNSATTQILANLITIQIRDFAGIPEAGVAFNNRPITLTPEHNYNIQNQGWASGSGWSTVSTTTQTLNLGIFNFTVQAGLPAKPGQAVTVSVNAGGGVGGRGTLIVGYATVNTYSGTTLNITFNSVTNDPTLVGHSFSSWSFQSAGSYIQVFDSAIGVFPSNADIWWLFKDSSGLFNTNNISNVTLANAPAPQGSFILNAFNQDRTNVSGVTGLTKISTTVRPRTGCWFQGRVWYSGVDANQQATGDAPYTTWTENIYFSQVVQQTQDFGTCYQTNDPTAENFFDLLPTDGGVIVIQGSGSIYKLFPVQNGLLVFATNGIWFITGNTGLGFAANDYTVTKISGIQSISGTSFVNVLGWPIFWNQEGIYEVMPGNQSPEGIRVNMSGIQVENLTVGNILSFYQNIPNISKQYVRGDYDPINYQVQWLYRSTVESGISNRYQYDSILVHNTVELPRARLQVSLGKAFYPYSLPAGGKTSLNSGIIFPFIYGIRFVQNPTGGALTPNPVFKYLAYTPSVGFSFAEENNFTNFADWFSIDSTGVDAAAFAIAGYNLKPQHHPYYGLWAQALVKHSVSYVNVFLRNTANNGYLFNSVWDWASDPSSGKFSSQQKVTNNLTSNKFQFITKRHRVRGRGYSVQFQFQSQPGLPMDLIGWSVFESVQEAP